MRNANATIRSSACGNCRPRRTAFTGRATCRGMSKPRGRSTNSASRCDGAIVALVCWSELTRQKEILMSWLGDFLTGTPRYQGKNCWQWVQQYERERYRWYGQDI